MTSKTFNGFSVKEQLVAVIALLLIVGVIGWFTPVRPGVSLVSTGAPNIEDYDPNVMQNGFNTNKAASFGSTLSVTGATTLSSTLGVTGAATLTDDLTVNGRNFTLTTSNSATSTAIMGCIQTYATSTETAWKIGIGSIATSSPFYSAGTGTNFVLAGYGTCPF